MSEVINLGKIYLESPCCIRRFPIQKIQKQYPYDGEETIDCPYCESPSEISEWSWYEKVKIVAFRPMKNVELQDFILVTRPRGEKE